MKTKPNVHPARPVSTASPLADAILHRFVVVALFLLPLVFYGKYLFGGRMLFGTDWLGAGGYQMREFMARYIASHGTIAFWMPGILSGQPTLAAFFGDLFYPTALLRLVLPVHVVWTWTFALHVTLAGLGTYLFLRALKLGVIPAAVGGVAYMFAGSLLTLTYAGHDGRLIGSALLPLALYFLHRGMTSRQLVHFLLAGFVLALQLLSGHIQKVYYTGLVLVAYFIYMFVVELRRERSPGLALRLVLMFAAGMVTAGALAAVQYLPIYANMPFAARGSERGWEYATSWSMPIIETFDLFTPRFSGGLDAYWSSNAFKLHSEYLGILPLLLAAVAVFRRWKDRSTKFFTFSFLGALVMAWGGNTPLYYVPYYLFPGVSKFRGPAMIFFVAAFCLAVLAGLGFDWLVQAQKDPERRKTARTALIAGAVPLFLLLVFGVLRGPLEGLLRSATVQNEAKFAALAANYPNLLGGFALGALFAALGCGIVLLLLRRRIGLLAAGIAAAALLTIDAGLSLNLWNETKGYIRGVPPPAEYFAADEAIGFLKTDTSLYRVLPLYYEKSDDGRLMGAGVQSAGGQMPNPLQAYQDFTGAGSSVMFEAGNLMSPAFMNVLNIRYVISLALPDDATRYDERSRQVIEQLRAFFSQPWFRPAFVGRQYAVYENMAALPRAFVVASAEVARDRDDLLARMRLPGFDPARTALLYEDPGLPPATETATPGVAAVTAFDPNRVTVKATTRAPGLLVLSENWHPDWRATVDGKATKVLRAFHTLRAVRLEPGEHEVVFRYSSPTYRLGLALSLVALLAVVLVLALTLVAERRRRTHANAG